ncbi:MAG: FecR domain-containing protein [Myxococcales bacterium]|nr:FecR domain-containing protein [Myxococcales bacterium]
MTDRDDIDALSPEEKQALEAWTPPVAPPADLAQQLLARLDDEDEGEAPQQQTAPQQPAPQRRRLTLLAMAAAALLALGGVLLFALRPPVPRAGAHVASERSTLRVGRAIAVAEKGAALSWSVDDASGELVVEQRRGEVFYRVDKGRRPFIVRTPRGEVRVLGTCFRVEVRPMRASRAGLIGAAVGAAAATLVFVSVYEGKVLTASTHGRAEVKAGEKATLAAGKAPRVHDAHGAKARVARGAGKGDGRRAGALSSSATAASMPHTPAKLRQQNEQLRAEVADLRSKLEKASGEARKVKMIDLSKEELLSMAKTCELRWDTPGLVGDVPKASSKIVKQLGMNDTERDGVNKAFSEFHERTKKVLRKLYVDVTGDAKGADELSLNALAHEITSKSPRDEIKRAFRQLSHERAGLLAKPADPSKSSAVEQLYRYFMGVGDQVERDIGKAIGPDLARRYREAGKGFGSQSRSSYGCPK